MKRGIQKKCRRCAAWLTALVLWAGMLPWSGWADAMNVPPETPQKTQSYVQPQGDDASTPTQWQGDCDYNAQDGSVTLRRVNEKNSFAVSGAAAVSMEYEADVRLVEGYQAAGLLFGLRHPDEIGNQWCALQIGPVEDGSVYGARLFCESDQAGLNVSKKLWDVMPERDIHLRLVIDQNKKMSVYIDGQPSPVIETTYAAYSGGNVGFCAWNTLAEFRNIGFLSLDPPPAAPNFVTNLSGWKASGGTWYETEQGLLADNKDLGDTFYLSDTFVPADASFLLEADITLESGDGNAAGIVFGVPDRDQPGARWYCLNVDKHEGKNKLIGKNAGFDRNLTDQQKTQRTFRLKIVKMAGQQISAYVDGELMCQKQDGNFPGGYIGVMTYFSKASFNNVNFTLLGANEPRLTNLELEGAAWELGFDPVTWESMAVAPYENEVCRLRPTAAPRFTITVDGTPVESGSFSEEISLQVGANMIPVTVSEPDSGASKTLTLVIKREQNPITAYTEQYRPQFHYSPQIGRLGDANGLSYYNGMYHMFYQYFPAEKLGSTRGYWGHAISKDLVHWEEQAPAFGGDEMGGTWSGSAVIDTANSSRLFAGTPGGMVAAYTATIDTDTQQQAIAYSADGLHWSKYNGGKPVISRAQDPCNNRDFRDPRLFSYGGKWFMAVAGGPLRIYSSDDLIDWTLESSYGGGQDIGGTWVESIYSECPDLFPIQVEGSGETKFVYNEAGRFYRVGDFRQVNGKWYFIPDTNERYPIDFGPDVYAAQTYYGTDANGTPDGRRIMTAWMNCWGYVNDLYQVTDPYDSLMVLHRDLKLVRTGDGLRLSMAPIEEYQQLRDTENAVTLKDAAVTPGGENLLGTFAGKQYEIVANLRPQPGAEEVGFKLRTGGGQETAVRYHFGTHLLSLDRSKSGRVVNGQFLNHYDYGAQMIENGVSSHVLSPKEDGSVDLRIFVDWSSIEVFGNGGETTGSMLIFPDATSMGAQLYALGGSVDADVAVYPLDSIWRESESEVPVDSVSLSLPETAQLYVDEIQTVYASVEPASAPQQVTWKVSDPEGAVETTGTGLALQIKGIKPGTVTIEATSGDRKAVRTLQVLEKGFHTNLGGWTASEGSWTVGDNGVTGDGGFYMAQGIEALGGDFTLSADVCAESGDALAFVIRASGTSAGYFVNFSMPGRNFRIFENPFTGDSCNLAQKSFEEAGVQVEYGRSYPMKVQVKDNKITVLFDGKTIFENVEDRNDTPMFTGNQVGLNSFASRLRFQNVYVSTESPIASVVTEIAPIEVEANTAADEVKAQLPSRVTVKQQDNITKEVAVTWSLDGVDLSVPGTYAAVGAMEGTDMQVKAQVEVTGTVPAPTVMTGLALSSGTLVPEFDAEILQYSAKVANSVDAIRVMPAYTGDTPVTVDGREIASETYSGDIALAVGENTITAVAGEKTYTITVTREDTQDPPVPVKPLLDALELSKGTLTPQFDRDENQYSAFVANSVDKVQVKAFFGESITATVVGKGVESGVFSDDIALEVGENTIEVKLTLGEEENTYRIIVSRARPEDTSKPPVTTKPGKPSITGGNHSDWKWPEGSASAGKDNPRSGDAFSLPIALVLLAGAAGTAAFIFGNRKK